MWFKKVFGKLYGWLLDQFVPSRNRLHKVEARVAALAAGKVVTLGAKTCSPTGVVKVVLAGNLAEQYAPHLAELEAHLSEVARAAVKRLGGSGAGLHVSLALGDTSESSVRWVALENASLKGQANPSAAAGQPWDGRTRKDTPESRGPRLEWVGAGRMNLLENLRSVGGGQLDYLRVPGLAPGALQAYIERGGKHIVLRVGTGLDATLQGRPLPSGKEVRLPAVGRELQGEIVGMGRFIVAPTPAGGPA